MRKIVSQTEQNSVCSRALISLALIPVLLYVFGLKEPSAFVAVNLVWIVPVLLLIPERPNSILIFEDRIEVKFQRRSELVFRKSDKVEIEIDGAFYSNFVISGPQGHVIIDDKFENWKSLVQEINRLWPEFESKLRTISFTLNK